MLGEKDGEIDATGVAIIVNQRIQGAGANACHLRKWLFQNGFAIDAGFRLGWTEPLNEQFFKPLKLFTPCLMVVSVQSIGGDFREGASIMGTRQLEQWRIVSFR